NLIVSSDASRSFFNDNWARSGGGAIAWQPGSTNTNHVLSVTDVTFYRNHAINGGAIWVLATQNSGIASESVVGCLFNNNFATNVSPFHQVGGGLDVQNSTTNTGDAYLGVVNSTFFHNLAGIGGGGINIGNANTGTGQNAVMLVSLTMNENETRGDGG